MKKYNTGTYNRKHQKFFFGSDFRTFHKSGLMPGILEIVLLSLDLFLFFLVATLKIFFLKTLIDLLTISP